MSLLGQRGGSDRLRDDSAPVVARSAETRSTRHLLRDVPLVVRWFAAGIVLVAALAIANHVSGANWAIFKLGEESNIPTWFSSIQLAAVAFVLGAVVGPVVDRRPRTWAVMLAPGFFAFLSLDEVATLHERLGVWLQTETGFGSGLRTRPWMFAFVPLVGLMGLFAIKVFWPFMKGRSTAMILGIAGVALFGMSAVGFESLGNLFDEGTAMVQLLGFVEEIGEMVAANLLLWSAMLIAVDEGLRLSTDRSMVGDDKPA